MASKMFLYVCEARTERRQTDRQPIAEVTAALFQLLGPAFSRHNHRHHSSSSLYPRDRRIPCAERYDCGTRRRHRRGLDVARHQSRAAAHGEPRHGVKPAREIYFVGCPASDPGPAEPLSTAEEGQINVTPFTGQTRTNHPSSAAARTRTPTRSVVAKQEAAPANHRQHKDGYATRKKWQA